ncbi:hypothetical protein JQ600_31900 [Bradyrhizobium sp. AUGA SZCCT0176]|uniref:hypothetical protein n=1 Tax=Bradyrhizobium sp. AUGA SZCCT0176 TaxID=2807664 RepID=UPI001BAC0905|nr:hypothetical protein [Bradyrhizobium sp. AUGA SZCCT0176]MBR1229497.1 hypothetical protein [Bradyrhizobium sp. AUGA SZCCT0176]
MAPKSKKPIARSQWRCLWILGALVLAPLAAKAQSRNVEFICVADMVSGLGYDSGSQKWKAMTFPIEHKFNLRLKFLSAKATKNIFDKDDVETKYEVAVTTSAQKTPTPCVDFGRGLTTEITVTEFSYLSCYWGGLGPSRQLRLNLKNKRFLEVYLHGYLDGEDVPNTGPALLGGSCKELPPSR